MKWVVWVSLFATSVAGYAQTQQAMEQALKKGLEKKAFCIRGFSADSVVNFRWNGAEMELPAPIYRTLGVITVSSVKLNQDILEIDGARSTILKKENGSLAISGETAPVKILVAWRGAVIASLAKVPGALFYGSLQDEVSDLPLDIRSNLPSRDQEPSRDKLKTKPASVNTVPLCDCYANDANNCGHRPGSQGWTYPKLLKSESPDLTVTENGILNVKGFTIVVLQVDTDGHTSNLWLGRPLGSDIDTRVLSSLKKWAFSPATCHGTPVATKITIDNNFGMP